MARRSADASLERVDGQIQPAHQQERLLRTLWYNIGCAVVQLLKPWGDNLTRENIMKQASHLDMELLLGICLKTSPADPRPIKQMRLVRFDGQRYVLFSDVLTCSRATDPVLEKSRAPLCAAAGRC